jgi:hypothetical protein
LEIRKTERIIKIWDSFEKINKDKNKQIINSKMIILENISICDFEAMAERLYGY